VREWLPWMLFGLGVVMFVGFRSLGPRPDSSEIHRLVADGAALIDVRTAGEFASGHLDGARNIPVDQLAARAGEIGPKDQPVVVYCRSGARSAAAASNLQQLGFVRVADLGPMSNW
jgi:phage shock protein E